MASPVHLWSLTQPPSGSDTGTVNYRDLRPSNGRRKTPGAFRVVQVKPLLRNPPIIKLSEFSDIRFGGSRNAKADLKALQSTAAYRYVAVSHVWEYGAEVEQERRNMTIDDDLNIDVDDLATKEISWRGLVQIAHAVNSNHLGALEYFWLDLLCIDQVDRNDKEMGLQICIMSGIYTAASSVLVMIGGVPCVQSTRTPTAWMDRAWTLQEAILNRNQWIFIKWSTNPAHQSILDPNSVKGPNPQKVYWRFRQVPWPGPGLKPGEGLYVVQLRDLLDLADAQPLSGLPTLPPVAVLDGLTYRAGDAPRHALRTCLSYDRHVRYTGVWRSMFMRTSSKPVDVVYSIMGIFGISIDPYRKNRPPYYLFNDLARKTAAKARIGPAWMMLSGVGGSEIRRNKLSGILPVFPHAEGANIKSSNQPPTLLFGKGKRKRREWVGYHVDHERFYIPQYDIKFLTHSHPHIINSRMMELKSHIPQSSITLRRYGVKASKSTIASIRLGSAKGQFVYLGNIPDHPPSRTVYALYVGKIGDMSKRSGMLGQNGFVEFSKRPRVNFGGQHYLIFIKWDKRHKKWDCIADGAWKPNGTYWRPPTARYMLTMGAGSQKTHKRWPVPSNLLSTLSPNNLDLRRRRLAHSYGFEPLPDFGHSSSHKRINWGYYRLDSSPGIPPSWSKRHINYNLRGLLSSQKKLDKKLEDTSALSVLSARSKHPPKKITERTPTKITNDGHAVVPYSYDGWSRSECSKHSLNGVNGILIPKPGRTRGQQDYWVRIWFGERVMYVQMKFHRKTPKEYWNMVVVPYRKGGGGGYVVNGKYIRRPVRKQPYPNTPSWRSGPQGYPAYQPPGYRPPVGLCLPTFLPRCVPFYYTYGCCY